MRAQGKPNSNPRYDYEKAKAIVDSNPQLRILTDVEKEQLISRILDTTFLDLTDDWAFKRVLGGSLELQKSDGCICSEIVVILRAAPKSTMIVNTMKYLIRRGLKN